MQNFQIGNRKSSVIIALKYSFAFDVMVCSNVVYFDKSCAVLCTPNSCPNLLFQLFLQEAEKRRKKDNRGKSQQEKHYFV